MLAGNEILIATRNAGKIEELRAAFATLPLTLRTLNEFGNISEVPEVGTTYEENATLKAMGYWRQTGITALAGSPGVSQLTGRMCTIPRPSGGRVSTM